MVIVDEMGNVIGESNEGEPSYLTPPSPLQQAMPPLYAWALGPVGTGAYISENLATAAVNAGHAAQAKLSEAIKSPFIWAVIATGLIVYAPEIKGLIRRLGKY